MPESRLRRKPPQRRVGEVARPVVEVEAILLLLGKRTVGADEIAIPVAVDVDQRDVQSRVHEVRETRQRLVAEGARSVVDVEPVLLPLVARATQDDVRVAVAVDVA